MADPWTRARTNQWTNPFGIWDSSLRYFFARIALVILLVVPTSFGLLHIWEVLIYPWLIRAETLRAYNTDEAKLTRHLKVRFSPFASFLILFISLYQRNNATNLCMQKESNLWCSTIESQSSSMRQEWNYSCFTGIEWSPFEENKLVLFLACPFRGTTEQDKYITYHLRFPSSLKLVHDIQQTRMYSVPRICMNLNSQRDQAQQQKAAAMLASSPTAATKSMALGRCSSLPAESATSQWLAGRSLVHPAGLSLHFLFL